MFILRFAKALAALSCSGGVFFIPVKSSIQINHNFVHLALCQSFSCFVLLRWHFFIPIQNQNYLFI
ncbi:hypothetical protein CV954_008355 [Acinetobacter baumannii]|uniref:Uncharacterized protein n=1 Tax=Acinetobacter baumannii TaxID=470 RepID=A0AA44XU51_ACIBA|nr:hypothetical protein CV954_008355 [Acinetobacter baumannii]